MSQLNEVTKQDVYNLATPEEIIEDARNGRMYILVDAEDRENEGDLIVPAQFATPDAINFMAKFGRGLICLALEKQRAEILGLKNMSVDNASRFETAFTQSIEAREGVTTGISAGDRAARFRLRLIPIVAPTTLSVPVTCSQSLPKKAVFWCAQAIRKPQSIFRGLLVSTRLP